MFPTFKKFIFKEYKVLFGQFHYHRMSKIFPPITDDLIPPTTFKKHRTVVQQLMYHMGIMSSYNQGGLYALLPMGMRSLEKLMEVVDACMNEIDAQKISLPSLTSSLLWEQSGRLARTGSEILKVVDRHDHEFVLSPTHEESITYVIAQRKQLSHNHLPVRVYQMSTKFRDEARLKFGLIRAREFLMKDLYTFDASPEDALHTYNQVTNAYKKIFSTINLEVHRVKAAVGSIGGSLSHEFHIVSHLGEDKLLQCSKCKEAFNAELQEEISMSPGSECKHDLQELNGIEIGHTFFLGTKYSAPMSAYYKDADAKNKLLHMGCYGIGLTRLLGAALEAFSTDTKLIWPRGMEPFKVCVIPPKEGSRESVAQPLCDHLASIINANKKYHWEVIVDDRTKLTIGKRLRLARNLGFPIIIVAGKTAVQDVPQFEVYDEVKNVNFKLTQIETLAYLASQPL